ncbi:hypothetical protein Moror_2659 [Moniliophthora roreri MCA 2997]|uniref:Uncharacterized protein n=2 Tax=Moniliophthora roreri TaxID=221103 RepID=V2XF50_MONRO|nr:hypothetical protein Moror_2659 [Moniliophthora roreri MCA 2997]
MQFDHYYTQRDEFVPGFAQRIPQPAPSSDQDIVMSGPSAGTIRIPPLRYWQPPADLPDYEDDEEEVEISLGTIRGPRRIAGTKRVMKAKHNGQVPAQGSQFQTQPGPAKNGFQQLNAQQSLLPAQSAFGPRSQLDFSSQQISSQFVVNVGRGTATGVAGA